MGRENNSDRESDSAIYSVDCRNISIVTTSTTSSEEEKERQKGKKIGTKEGQRKKNRTRRQHGCFSREQNNLRHLTPHGCKKQGGREQALQIKIKEPRCPSNGTFVHSHGFYSDVSTLSQFDPWCTGLSQRTCEPRHGLPPWSTDTVFKSSLPGNKFLVAASR